MIKKLEIILKNYGKTVDQAQQKFDTDTKFIKENYLGDLRQQQLTQIIAGHEKTVYEAKESTRKSVAETIVQLNEKVGKTASTSNLEAMNELNALRGLKLSKGELGSLAEKYKTDYMAMKLLSSLANESGLVMKYTSVDDLSEMVQELSETSKTFIEKYNGTKESKVYKTMLITEQEHPFSQYEDAFNNSSISIMVKPREPLTPEQKETVNNLFKGYENTLELRVSALKVLGMPGEKLLSDYYESIAEDAGE